MPDTPFPTPELQQQADVLEAHIQEAEAEFTAAHPPSEGWSPMIGQDVDGEDEEAEAEAEADGGLTSPPAQDASR